jgi:hypothetical protein
MATPAEIQAQLDSAGTGLVANIQQSVHAGATFDNHYVVGIGSYAGRSRWIATTAAQTAAQQATAILAGLASS